MVGGFACTYHLSMGTLADWNVHPFMTNVEKRPIAEVQFPTVTVCRDPFRLPDRWSLVGTAWPEH